MSEGDGNPENKDLVSQITADLNAIADLSRALIPSLLSSEESLAGRTNNGAGSSRDAQSQGEYNRQIGGGGGGIMNPQHVQGIVSNYLPGNPAQQNQTYGMGMGNAVAPFVSNAALPFLGNAAQYCQGYAPPHLMGNYYQGNAAPTYGSTGNAANWPMNSACIQALASRLQPQAEEQNAPVQNGPTGALVKRRMR